MREILFRAKAINRIDGESYRTNYKNGDWVYGLIEDLGNKSYGLPATMRNEQGISNIDVDIETVGEYTYQEDRNGNKIFEGDICLYGDCIGVVEFDEDDGMFTFTFDQTICTNFGQICGTDLEIVGNIYENPELLEVKENDL